MQDLREGRTVVHHPELLSRFLTPGKEYGPTPLWWWSGGNVTRDGIRWQLEKFREGHIDNLVVMNLAPKGPTYGAKPDNPVWFSEEWWALFEYACEVAAEFDMKLWFYDQIGFSGANLQGQITAEHSFATGQGLHSRLASVGEQGALPLLGRENLIGVFAERTGDGWMPVAWSNDVAQAPSGTAVRIVTWEEKAFDYLNPDACALLIDFVHGEFERRLPQYLGSVITGSFQDELPATPTWSAGFLSAFETIVGYDLWPHLPSLWEHGDERDSRIRADYQRVRTALAERSLFAPLGEWHRSRGMLIGADQFNPARAGWPTQGVQVYADYVATHRHYNAVGSDHEGDSRIHSSMADLYDHPRVWIESFHSSGWGSTLEDTWDWLIPFFRSGANLYNPHASFYNTHAGWFEWAPPSTDFRQPYFALYPQFSTAVARVSSLLTCGRHIVQVGVLYPSSTMQALLPPDLPVDHFGDGQIGDGYARVDETQATYLKLAGTNNWFRSAPGLLDGLGVDFDIVDENSVQNSVAGGGALNVNGFSFRVIILPSTDFLDADTALRLIEFADTGGLLIAVGRLPQWAIGLMGDDSLVARLAAHPSLVHIETADEIGSVLPDMPAHVWAAEAVRAQRVGESVVAFVPAAYPNASAYPLRKPGDYTFRWEDYDFDPGRYGNSTELRIAAEASSAELWNPATGERRGLDVRVDNGVSTVVVDFRGAPAVFVVWNENGSVGVSGSTDAQKYDSEPLADGWTSQLVSTLDNTWGDFALPPSTTAIPLELWKLNWSHDGAEPVDVKSTFGQEVLVGGPFALSTSPAPLSPQEAAAVLDGAQLADDGWAVHTYSATRGVDKDPTLPLGGKGFVPDEFVRHERAADGEEVVVRAILRVDAPGDYDLTVFGSAAKRVWLDGVELVGDGSGYFLTVQATFTGRTAVLEYRLGRDESAGMFASLWSGGASGFALDRPGQHARFPEFIGPESTDASSSSTSYHTAFTLSTGAVSARVVTGSASALALAIDGTVRARQEKVEYYESDWGGNPMFFTHDLGPIPAGDHSLDVEVFTTDPRGSLFVDLFVEHEDGRREVIVSDGTWTTGAQHRPVALRPGFSAQLTHARAAIRPHPLRGAHWLVGEPEIGELSVAFESASSAVPRPQSYDVLLPAGARQVALPGDVTSANVEGVRSEMVEGQLVLDHPLDAPARLHIALAPRAFSVGGAAWTGPLEVMTSVAPATFGDWHEQGLGSWSGGVRYVRSIAGVDAEAVQLDLGRVKGAVSVSVDGQLVGSAFCAPYVFDLGVLGSGDHEIAVILYSTLAQRFDSASPTTWIFPSQLEVGIFGPVTLGRS